MFGKTTVTLASSKNRTTSRKVLWQQFTRAAVSCRQFLKFLACCCIGGGGDFPAILRSVVAKNQRHYHRRRGRSSARGKFLDAAKVAGVDGKIVAVADIFPEQAANGKKHFGVPEENCFSGFDGYQKALAVPGVNYAIIATPPGFRPPYFKACVDAGKNVFTEKPVSVDGPGCRIMYAAGEEAKKKNLKVGVGLQRHHQLGYIETMNRLWDGAIGDVVSMRCYWNGGPIWRGDKGDTELENRFAIECHYIWLYGDHICEQHIHNLDVINWLKNGYPVRCHGIGGRCFQKGPDSGEIFDHHAVEYEYANGVRMHAYCGQVKRDWSSVSEAIVGSNGTANPGGSLQTKDGQRWRFPRDQGVDPYMQEHVDLINAIVKDTELNETKNVTDTTLTAILGREAAYSGAAVEWDTVLNSKFIYGPDLLYKDAAA